jgi:hypothetical protein
MFKGASFTCELADLAVGVAENADLVVLLVGVASVGDLVDVVQTNDRTKRMTNTDPELLDCTEEDEIGSVVVES